MSDVLDTNVDPLFDVAIAHDFMDDDTNGAFCDVVDDARSTVNIPRSENLVVCVK